jgi:hypothetical protein
VRADDDNLGALALRNEIQDANSNAGACIDLHHPSGDRHSFGAHYSIRGEGNVTASKPLFWAGADALCAAKRLEPGAARFHHASQRRSSDWIVRFSLSFLDVDLIITSSDVSTIVYGKPG